MIPKQDRLRPRTVEDLERMYKFRESKQKAQEAAQIANEAKAAATGMDAKLTQAEIFNRLTNNGQAQGFFMLDGQLYVNANYITTGVINADLIKAGSLTSADGASVIFNLLNNTLKISSPNFSLSETGSVVATDLKAESNDSTGEYSTKIEDGVVKIRSPRKFIAADQPQQIDLFHFNITDEVVFRLYISVHYEEVDGELVWSFDGFGIAPVEETTEEETEATE